eukprot:COSAG05_NODE_1467_length_4795_cov_1.624574_4_plen_198_part_00
MSRAASSSSLLRSRRRHSSKSHVPVRAKVPAGEALKFKHKYIRLNVPVSGLAYVLHTYFVRSLASAARRMPADQRTRADLRTLHCNPVLHRRMPRHQRFRMRRHHMHCGRHRCHTRCRRRIYSILPGRQHAQNMLRGPSRTHHRHPAAAGAIAPAKSVVNTPYGCAIRFSRALCHYSLTCCCHCCCCCACCAPAWTR